MRTKPLVGMVMILSTLCLVLSSLWLRAEQPLSSNSEALDAVWVAQDDGLRQVSASEATVLVHLADARHLRAVAVDAPRGVVWTYGDKTLRAYRLTGERLYRLPLGHGGKQGDNKDAVLQVHPDTGSVWVGLNERLYQVGAQGEWLSVHSWPDPVRALAWDPSRSCLWVATKEGLRAITDTGAPCAHVDVGRHADIRDLMVDPASGTLWLALKKALRSYTAEGTLRFELRADTLERLASDHQGGVWGTTHRMLFRLDPWGRLLLAVEPFDHHEKLVALVADPTDASVWVATTRELQHLSPDGRRWHRVAFKSAIRALAFSPAGIPPSLSFTAPQDGDTLNTNLPLLALHYGASGTGVDLTTLAVQANGVDVPITCQDRDAQATCTPASAFSEGVVTLTATVQDYAGNRADASEVRVTIDTIAPMISLTTPADGLVTNQAQQTFVGTLNEAATLTLNGAAVPVDPHLTFTHGPVALQDGLNTFELLATDTAGNRRQRQVHVTFDTVSPTAMRLALNTSSWTSSRDKSFANSTSTPPGSLAFSTRPIAARNSRRKTRAIPSVTAGHANTCTYLRMSSAISMIRCTA